MKKHIILILVAILCLPTWGQDTDQIESQNSSNWQIDVTPYVWLAGFKADIGFRDLELGQVQADFSDILENLKMGALLHAEASNGKWIIMGDLMYFKTSKGGSLDINSTPTELNTKLLVTELGVGINMVNDENAFLVDAFIGWRSISSDNVMTIGSRTALDRNSNANDPFIGARMKIKSEKWLYSLRADVGGFGIGTKSSLKISTLGAYSFSDLFALYFGFQALDIKIEKSDFNFDILTTGFVVGGNFSF